MPTKTTPECRIGCRIDVMTDGSLIVGPTDGSHAYAIALTPAQLRSLAVDMWAVAERLQPLIATAPGAGIAGDDAEVVAWN